MARPYNWTWLFRSPMGRRGSRVLIQQFCPERLPFTLRAQHRREQLSTRNSMVHAIETSSNLKMPLILPNNRVINDNDCEDVVRKLSTMVLCSINFTVRSANLYRCALGSPPLHISLWCVAMARALKSIPCVDQSIRTIE